MSSFGPRTEAWFLRQWQRNGPAQLFLRPVSWVFGALSAFRRALFRMGALPQVRVARPVIVAGNISVGGTGKTPLVIGILESLKSAGIPAGVVARGYQRDATDSTQVADEAKLIFQRTGAPVVTDQDRVAACARLIAQHPEVQVIVSDDGLQHYRLGRDLEICVIDGARGLGNGALLPAGPLREPRSRLARVDALVINRTLSNLGSVREIEMHSAAPVFSMVYGEECLVSLTGESRHIVTAVEEWHDLRLCAMAGIGHPQRFFSHVARLGLQCAEQREWPDHHAFVAADINECDADIVLVTEKDAVKLAGIAAELNKPVWALRISAQLPAGFHDFLLARSRALIAAHVPRSETA